jgi:hypothetical protein
MMAVAAFGDWSCAQQFVLSLFWMALVFRDDWFGKVADGA